MDKLTRLLVRQVIPSLTNNWYKGQHGRVGVLGGCLEYTGAPYYAGIASLKTGADLCFVFCAEEAAIPIKSYSPELIVHPVLVTDRTLKQQQPTSSASDRIACAIDQISDLLPRLDTLVIGPGLGRDQSIQEITSQVIQRAKEQNLSLVLDGDALFLLSTKPQLIQGYRNAILTPNGMEYARLCAAVGLIDQPDPKQAQSVHPSVLSQRLGNPVIVQKGQSDVFSDGTTTLANGSYGCPRRCGGQGDILAGSIATFVAWTRHLRDGKLPQDGDAWLPTANPLLLAAFGGSLLTRRSSQEAFVRHRRSMTSPDVLEAVGQAFDLVFSINQ